MTTSLTTAAGERTWQDVICLLLEAARRGHVEAASNPAVRSTASGAHITATLATGLLSHDALNTLDDVELAEETTTMTLVELLHAAEAATRHHPIEQLPRGASRIIIDLHALIREVTP